MYLEGHGSTLQQIQKLTKTIEMYNAFNNAKRAHASATLLAHPRCDVAIEHTSDALDRGVGTVFEQFVDAASLFPQANTQT